MQVTARTDCTNQPIDLPHLPAPSGLGASVSVAQTGFYRIPPVCPSSTAGSRSIRLRCAPDQPGLLPPNPFPAADCADLTIGLPLWHAYLLPVVRSGYSYCLLKQPVFLVPEGTLEACRTSSCSRHRRILRAPGGYTWRERHHTSVGPEHGPET